MTWRLNAMILGCMLVGGTVLQTGCTEVEGTEDENLDEAEGGGEGAFLFNHATFGGNGRTCASCHPSGLLGTGTLSPFDVQLRFLLTPNNPLFRHDAADTIGGNTFNRFRTHATILVPMPLPPNVTIAGSSERTVVLPRSIPTTMNTPALDPVLMVDGRAPNLEDQARDAILRHAQSSNVSQSQVEAIADFELTLFNRYALRQFAQNGTPLSMPAGVTQAQKRGRRWFIADGQTSPEQVGETPQAVCGWCHSGNFLNGMSGFFVTNVSAVPVPEGFRFFTALVSELNPLGNPVYNFEFHAPDGSVVTVPSPDPGISLLTGQPPPFGAGFFKISTLWGTRDTAPYFHDNSAKTIEALVEHYDAALQILSATDPNGVIDLTTQDKADIAAYLRLL